MKLRQAQLSLILLKKLALSGAEGKTDSEKSKQKRRSCFAETK